MIPWKLVVIVALAILLALFIGFNLGNKCEISFVFGKVEAVPVYLTVLFSFIAGMAAALPFAFRKRSRPKAALPGAGAAEKQEMPGRQAGLGEEGAALPAAGDEAGGEKGQRPPEASGKPQGSESHGGKAGKRGRRK